jgi:hypothetical protein
MNNMERAPYSQTPKQAVVLLTSSFTYVRDWINKRPFKNEPNARLICDLCTDAPIRPETIL